VIADTHQNPEWIVMPETAWIKSSVSVPICVPDRVLGLLRLDSSIPGAFSAQDVQYLQHLANAAAIALTNARLYDQAQRELAERIKTEKELRFVAARNQAILDAIPDFMFYLSRNGDLLDYKIASYNELSEIPTEVINGSHVSTLLPPNLVDLTLQCIAQTLDTGKIQLFEYELGEHHFEVRLVKSGPNEVLAIIRNITQRKQTEAELQEAKEAAEAANRAKSTFLANMGHELHTPLHHIIGYSEMLQEEAFDLRQESFLPDLRKIEAAGKHLLTLVDSILDLAKIEAGKMELQLETFRLPALIDEVVTTARSLIEENGNTLEVRCSDNLGDMYGDRTKIRQVLLNLLSNAAKFTEQGMITLMVERMSASPEARTRNISSEDNTSILHRSGEAFILFQVTDTGMGIAPEQQPRLFRAFTQVDPSATRRHGGSGLGLVISQRFCQMMGGNITVESELGRGSTFTVYLPIEIRGLPQSQK
jgi:signal transduction histidine kinase